MNRAGGGQWLTFGATPTADFGYSPGQLHGRGDVSVGIAGALFDNEVLGANAAAVLGAATSDVVLLAPAGTSYDQFKDFAERGDTFRRLVAAEKTK